MNKKAATTKDINDWGWAPPPGRPARLARRVSAPAGEREIARRMWRGFIHRPKTTAKAKAQACGCVYVPDLSSGMDVDLFDFLVALISISSSSTNDNDNVIIMDAKASMLLLLLLLQSPGNGNNNAMLFNVDIDVQSILTLNNIVSINLSPRISPSPRACSCC